MKIQYNQIIGQPVNTLIYCDSCCFPECIPVDLWKCSPTSFERANGDIFKL